MTLQEAIEHFRHLAEIPNYSHDLREAYRQKADWLTELSQLREEKRATGFQNGYDRGYECGLAVGRENGGYSNGYAEGIEDGRDEAWDAAQWIMEHDSMDLVKIFDTGVPKPIFQGNVASEAIVKIKAWEESKAIHIGDIVTLANKKELGIVTQFAYGSNWHVLWQNGKTAVWEAEKLTKTGRKVDVEEFLKKIWGDDEEAENENTL